MESASVENHNDLASDEKKKEVFSSSSYEPRERKRIFFETKSLAEVYAKQGHILMALEIYRRIFEKNPSDDQAEKRISELEGHLSAKRGIRFKEQDI